MKVLLDKNAFRYQKNFIAKYTVRCHQETSQIGSLNAGKKMDFWWNLAISFVKICMTFSFEDPFRLKTSPNSLKC